MDPVTYVRIAGRNLLRARRRSLLLSAALAMVTAFLVFLLSMSQGITENMIRSATTLTAGHVNVAGFYKTRPTDSAPFVVDVERVKEVVARTVPAAKLDFVIDRQRGWAKLVSDTGSIWSGLSGIEPEQERALAGELTVARERDYRPDEGSEDRIGDLTRLGQPGSITLFADQARRLKVRVGDQITIVSETFGGNVNSRQLTVTGIAENIGVLSSWTAFMAGADVRGLYGLKPDTTGAVMIYLKDIGDVPAVMNDLRVAFEKAGWSLMPHDDKPFFQKFTQVSGEDWTGQRLDITSWDDEVAFLRWVVRGFDIVSYFLVLILGVIIVVGIMNTMWISVRERTGEIGTLRAIGMHRGRVLALFLSEALLLGLAATAVGAVTGALISAAADAARIPLPSDALRAILISQTLHLSTGPRQVVIAILVFTVVTGLAAIWPATRAARMRPVTAMQAG